MKSISDFTLRLRDDREYEQVVFAEVLIPETPNVYGDYWTRDAIREAAYMFAKTGYGIDIDHDNLDRTGQVYVVESFIARQNDPDFIEGSWVIGMKIEDDTIWQAVLDGEINGYSYEAVVKFMHAILTMVDDGVRVGFTEPDLDDGHVHEFMVMVDENGRPIEGGTSETDGHSHTISSHTVTDEAEGHKHRYNLVSGKDGK